MTKQPDMIISNDGVQIGLKSNFYFNQKDGAIVKGSLSFNEDEDGLNGWINYSLLCNVSLRKDKLIFTDLNDRNIELYENILELQNDKEYDEVLIVNMSIDDYKDSLTSYINEKGLNYIKELVGKSDNPNSVVHNDWCAYLEKHQ